MRAVQPQFDLQDINAWTAEMLKESDRGAALIGCAYLEQLVEDLVRAKMIADDDVVNKLLKNRGPLANFSSQTYLAFALGWIGPQMYADLSTIRGIRNDFAHGLREGKTKQRALVVTFEKPSIRDRCRG